MREGSHDKALVPRRFSPPAVLCAVPVSALGPATETPGIPDQTLAMWVAVMAFVGAGVWMFRRYGRPVAPAGQPAPELSPA